MGALNTSDQFDFLPPKARADIMRDIMLNGNDLPTMSLDTRKMGGQGGVMVAGPVLSKDLAGYDGEVGPLTRTSDTISDPAPMGAGPSQETQDAGSAAGMGALSQLPEYKMPSLQDAMAIYAPQEQTQRQMYLALAAGLGRATKTGSLGESIGNAAEAMSTVQAEQQKLRMQYLPTIMNQLVQQQAMQYKIQSAQSIGQQIAQNSGYGAQAPGQGPGQAPGAPGAPAPGQAPAWSPEQHGGLQRPIPQALLRQAMQQVPFDNGKALYELQKEYSTPKWEMQEGYLRNTAAPQQQGFAPAVHTSAAGDTTVTMPGANGGVNVSAAPGAVDAKLALQGGTPTTVKVGSQEVQLAPAEFKAFTETGRLPQRYAALQPQVPGQLGAHAPGDAAIPGATASPAELARQGAEKVALETSARGQVENGTAYERRLLDTHAMNESMMFRNSQIAPLLQQVQTGKAGQATFAQLGTYLQNSGIDAPTVQNWLNKMAGGDTSVVKTIENQLAAAGITTMLTTLDKEGSPNRAMFQAVHEAQESLKSGNLTLQRVMQIQQDAYKNTLHEVNAMDQAKESRTYDPARWGTSYAKVRAQQYLPQEPVGQTAAPKVRRFNADGSVAQ